MQLLNILFCTLMFSGGLPILLPCVSIIFAVTYWAEKWELLKLSRVPSPYAGDLAALTGKPSPPDLTCMSCLVLCANLALHDNTGLYLKPSLFLLMLHGIDAMSHMLAT